MRQGKRKAVAAKRENQLAQASVAEEEERRQAWIQHYLAEGNYAEARALGWEGSEGLPSGSNTRCSNKLPKKPPFQP